MRFRASSLTACLSSLAVLLLLAACGPATETVPITQEKAAEALRSRLESAQLDVSWLAKSQRSDFFDSGVRRATLQIGSSSDSLINLYRFPDARQAAAAAARVSRNGMQVPIGGSIASVSWTGRPHFFRQGRLIALFCESGDVQPITSTDRRILAALQEVMGSQFAGLSRE